MKVLLVNGSPHQFGCTYTALEETGNALRAEGVACDHFWIGAKPISGCLSCGACRTLGRCTIDDCVNEFLDLAAQYDGFVFGASVHFASIAGQMSAFMDRVFYSDQCGRRKSFYLKPAASVVSARRAGTTAALDRMNKYLQYGQMPIISSQYWNMVHGYTPDDVRKDEEGLQIMRTLGRNMAWFLKCKEAGEKAGVPLPQKERRVATDYIR